MTPFQVFRNTLIILVTLGFAYLFVATINVWIVLWIAILLASSLRPSIEQLKSLGLPHGLAIALVYGMVAVAGIALVVLVLPPVVNEFVGKIQNENMLAFRINRAMVTIEESISGLINRPFSFGIERADITDAVETIVNRIRFTAPSLIGNVTQFIGDFILIFIMGIYWINSRQRAETFIVEMVPNSRKAQAHAIMEEIEYGLGAYVRGILLVSIIVGGLSFAAMLLAGVNAAASLSFIYGVATAVPIVGGLIGVVGATAIALLLDGGEVALKVLVITFILQQVENYYISPRIMAQRAEFDEILVIVFIAAGFTLNGLTGGLIAIPIAATVAILLKHLVFTPRRASVVPSKIDGGILVAPDEPPVVPDNNNVES